MKIAIIITGHIRNNYIGNLRSVINRLETMYPNNIDIYASIWDRTDNGISISNDHIFGQDITTQFLDLDKYNTTKPIFRLNYKRTHDIHYVLSLSKQEIFAQFMDESKKEERGTHCGFGPEAMEYWMNRLKDQYYPLSKAFKLIPNPNEYDLVFRLRTDFGLLKPISIYKEIKDKNYIYMIKGYDCFQYGNPVVMEKYFDLYNHIDEYSDNYCKLNQYGWNTFNSENLLRHYMNTNILPHCAIVEGDLVENKDFILGR